MRVRGILTATSNVALIEMFGLFVYAQGHRVVVDGVLTSAPFALQYALLFCLFIVRRKPLVVSRRPLDWLVGIGAWLPLFMRPADSSQSMAIAGASVAAMGAMLTIVGVASLGRSFGIVAANRGIQTSGAYQLLRHPVYSAECIGIVGNLICNPSLTNLAIAIATICLLAPRIGAEEHVLMQDASYRLYKRQVRWRLVPGVY
jgi:protein-S-isoprenylcysteine O-methyltransferase Ste14